jgi:CRISPR-associated endonuclease Csn1
VAHIHDGGVGNEKSAESRRAVSGAARRARRRLRHRRQQRGAVDQWLSDKGFPPSDPDADPWSARASLVNGVIADDATFSSLFSTAVSHIARHRGWRNPYLGTERLHSPAGWSENFSAMVDEARTRYPAAVIPDDPTPGQLGHAVRQTSHREKLRGPAADKSSEPGVLSSHRLHQSDHAMELVRIFTTQRIEDPEVRVDDLIDVLFHQESPKGSAEERVGDDALVPGRKRVWRADPAFQNYRIAAQLSNVRVTVPSASGGSTTRRLTVAEREAAYTLLSTWTTKARPTWARVSDALDLTPGALRAPTDRPDDGEDLTGAPCVNTTHQVLWNLPKELGALRDWYRAATPDARTAMVYHLFSNVETAQDYPTIAELDDLVAGLDSDALASLDDVRLGDGRGAYSAQTCADLTAQIISTEDDLYDARTHLYSTPADWAPPAAALTAPTGNAAVDRSLRQVNRMLCALESRYGAPRSITVENGRDGLTTAATARKRDYEAKARATERAAQAARVAEAFGIPAGSRPSPSQVRRFETVTRQNSACFYCGGTVSPTSAELDHIVPQAGPGSTTTRDNIVAACHRCNSDKSNAVAALWIDRTAIPGVTVEEITDRMDHWSTGPGERPADLKRLVTEIKRRLKQRNADPGIDARSTESTSWMATEVRRRLIQRYADRGETVRVSTFGGATTAEARRTWVAGDSPETAVSVNTIIEMAGGHGKQRLDRRHHALDAAVIAVMGQRASQVLAERRSLRRDAGLGLGQEKSADPVSGSYGKWRDHRGSTAEARSAFQGWSMRMIRAIDLFSQALQRDEVKVTRNLRVRLGDGKAHDDTVRKITRHLTVGRPWKLEDLNLLADHRAYTAMTSLPDMDWTRGLPADKGRSITVQGTTFGPGDTLGVLPEPGIAVRGGYVQAGNSTHHLRFYRYVDSKGRTKLLRERVFTHDLLSRHVRGEDLLTVELPEHSMTHRFVPGFGPDHAAVRARREGNAEFIGSVLIGDELRITEQDARGLAEKTASLAALQAIVGPVTRWLVQGSSQENIQLTPYMLAGEGIGTPHCAVEEGSPAAGMWEVVSASGKVRRARYRPALNKISSLEHVEVIRRTALGDVRHGESPMLTSFTLVDNRE